MVSQVGKEEVKVTRFIDTVAVGEGGESWSWGDILKEYDDVRAPNPKENIAKKFYEAVLTF